jgi:MFS family permease
MILAALTNALVVALPGMGLSVLLPEISKDLDLNLVQAGLVWGIGSLPMILTSLLAGNLVDRFGPKRVLVVSCILVGLAGATRALSSNFAMLMFTVLLSGVFGPLILLSNIKNAMLRFQAHQRGLANGLPALGMAAGFFLGSLVSATYLSPALGGWRNVFLVYGLIAVLFAIPWLLTPSSPSDLSVSGADRSSVSLRQGIAHLSRIKEMWLLGLAVLGVNGGIQGLLGYLPLYLQGLGWSVSSSSGVMAVFHVASMTFIFPLTFWSDRIGTRSRILLGAALLIAFGIGSLSLVTQAAIWVVVIMIGSVRDSFMAIFFARVNETRGVGSTNSGIATGFVMVFIGLGSLVAPPTGNALASLTTVGAPLLFWAAMAIFGGVCIYLTSRNGSLVVNKTRGDMEG